MGSKLNLKTRDKTDQSQNQHTAPTANPSILYKDTLQYLVFCYSLIESCCKVHLTASFHKIIYLQFLNHYSKKKRHFPCPPQHPSLPPPPHKGLQILVSEEAQGSNYKLNNQGHTTQQRNPEKQWHCTNLPHNLAFRNITVILRHLVMLTGDGHYVTV